uniref:Uncharacterized protein n=2 Tax=Electrophorus electricus TaxID=8005 RepID=A0A4W4F6L7_ELEEL
MIVDSRWEIAQEPNLYLKHIFGQSEGPAKLKRSALEFLKYNRYHLTMYAQPGLL